MLLGPDLETFLMQVLVYFQRDTCEVAFTFRKRKQILHPSFLVLLELIRHTILLGWRKVECFDRLLTFLIVQKQET